MPVSPRCHHRHRAPQAHYVDANHAIHLPLVAMPMATFGYHGDGSGPPDTP